VHHSWQRPPDWPAGLEGMLLPQLPAPNNGRSFTDAERCTLAFPVKRGCDRLQRRILMF
jgi:hypothetical protein